VSDWSGQEGPKRLDSSAAVASVGARGMFFANLRSSSADWVEQILGSDNALPGGKLAEWCRKLDSHPWANHIKYFAAVLRRDVAMVTEITGMPLGVVYRLQEALSNEHENPWRTRPLDLVTWQSLLTNNHVFIASKPIERIFEEIDQKSNGSITHADFETWLGKYRPVSIHQKRALVLHQMLASWGFWWLVCPLVGFVLYLISIPQSGPYSETVGVQILRTLWASRAIQNMMQAWRAKAVSCDAFEQAKMELKACVETACDRLEREQIKAASRAKKEAAITEVKRKIRVVASIASRGRGRGRGRGDGCGAGRGRRGRGGAAGAGTTRDGPASTGSRADASSAGSGSGSATAK
jgi:hypothetical protein